MARVPFATNTLDKITLEAESNGQRYRSDGRLTATVKRALLRCSKSKRGRRPKVMLPAT